MIYIAGHKGPDTDSICAAIAYAELKKKQGIDAKPARLGKLNPETEFVIKKFGFPVPELLEDVTGKQLIIVDHCESKQGPANIEKAEILEIVDHHRIGDLKDRPKKYIREMLGATCTIIYKLYQKAGIEPDKNIKGIIFSAILSDTWIFKSSATTQEDIDLANKLGKELDLDPKEYGLEMLEERVDFQKKTPEQIIKNDMKIYEFKKGKAFIGVYELIVGADELFKQKDEILKEMEKLHKKYETVMFAIMNISNEETKLFVFSKFEKEIEEAYNFKLKNHITDLHQLFSRKKKIVPILEKIMS